MDKKNYYKTIEEASTATIKLGIASQIEYVLFYKKDVQLHSNPNIYYSEKWSCWEDFLGKKKNDLYKSIDEAREASILLGIKNRNEYEKKHKKDSQLPSNPRRSYKDDWRSWPDFLGREKKLFYEDIADASKAAITLGINTGNEYRFLYKKDPQLPSSPNAKYIESWEGWPVFLGKIKTNRAIVNFTAHTEPTDENKKRGNKDRFNFYESIEEASANAKSLGISGKNQYKIYYKKDPRLPSCPNEVYKNWINWYHFLGKDSQDPNQRNARYYEKLECASNAAINLGIKTKKQYQKYYKKDDRLPLDPSKKYPDEWVSWDSFFLRIYTDPTQAKAAAHSLGITSYKQYEENRAKDTRLPVNPVTYYKRKGFNIRNFKEFIGLEYFDIDQIKKFCVEKKIKSLNEYDQERKKNPRLKCLTAVDGYREIGARGVFYKTRDFGEIPDCYLDWESLAVEFCTTGRNLTSKTTIIKRFINEYIVPLGNYQNVSTFFSTDNDYTMLHKWLDKISGKSTKSHNNNSLLSFFNYIYKKKCCVIDDSTGNYIPITGYRVPLSRINYDYDSPSETVKLALPYSYVLKARQWMTPKNSNSFSDLHHLHKLFDSDWYDIDKKKIDDSDIDCVYREIVKYQREHGSRWKKKKTYQMWSPVRSIALLTLFYYPLRGQQICWLDSGEWDEWDLKIIDGEYVWRKNSEHYAMRGRAQGFLKRTKIESGEYVIGMYCTTNKTADNFKEGGYSCPWMPDELIPWIYRLKRWQNKYNPIEKLTKWTDIELPRKVDANLLKTRQDQAFLFRNPLSRNPDKRSNPIVPSYAFKNTLPSVLYNIQLKENQLAWIDTNIKSTGLCKYRSEFTPHCMRVSLITSLVIDGEVDINIVSKIVGHSNVLMTLYYTKVGFTKIRQTLNESEKIALSKSVHEIQRICDDHEIEKLKPSLVCNTDQVLKSLNNKTPTAAYLISDIGICPTGGGMCNQGGEYQESSRSYLPVPNGYLGRRNCPRCRFFITGPAFLAGLQAISNELLYEIKNASEQVLKIERIQKKLEEKRFDCDLMGEIFLEHEELSKTIALVEQSSELVDLLTSDLISIIRLVKKSLSLLSKIDEKKGNEQSLILIGNGDITDLEFALQEITSEFRQLSEICENAEIFISGRSTHANIRRSQLIDLMISHNGMRPTMFKLSETQQLLVGNQFTRLLLNRFKSWTSIEELMECSIKFEDLVNESDLEYIKVAIDNLATSTPMSNSQIHIRKENE